MFWERLGRRLLAFVAALLALWAAIILALGATREGHEPPWRFALAFFFVSGLLVAARRFKFWMAMSIAIVASLLVAFVFETVPARDDRDWVPDQARAAYASFDGPRVTVHDVRDFRYRSTDEFEARWYDATYDTRELVKGYFIVEPFSGFYGAAHTFVSFRFRSPSDPADGSRDRFLAVSIEIRRERGEHFSPFRGLLKGYELAYVPGDERDLIDLRLRFRRDEMYLYPVAASHDRLAEYFVDMLRRMTALRSRPEYYDSLRSNCTTNLVAHLERITGVAIPRFDRRVILPAESDALVHDLHLLDAEGDLDSLRRRFRVSPEVAAAAAGRTDYSQRVRGEGAR